MTTAQTIWLSSPHMSGREMKYIEQAFANNHVFPLGPNVLGMERDLAALSGRHVTCLSSGTAAIHLALILLGVAQGDEVICSTLTFSASANPIVYQGATPVFVDSEAGTWNMDPDLLREAIQARIAATGRKPKAIILVHLYGMPARLSELMEIARSFDIPVIEDAAEALGSTYRAQPCGTFGDIGVYSFNGNKIITTSGGGALLSADPAHCGRALFLATQARDPAPHYQHSRIGYNYRMSNISAGIGRGQLEVLSERVAQRRAHHAAYRAALSDLPGVEFHVAPSDAYFSNHWLTALTLDPVQSGGIDRERVRLTLEAQGIESRPIWKPLHLQPVFADCPAYRNGVSERLFEQGLCLPSSSNMTVAERDRVVAVLRSVF